MNNPRSSQWGALRKNAPRMPWADMADDPKADALTRTAAKLFDGLAARQGTLVATQVWHDLLDFAEAGNAGPAAVEAFTEKIAEERGASYGTLFVGVLRLWTAVGTRVERQRLTREADSPPATIAPPASAPLEALKSPETRDSTNDRPAA